MSNKSGPKSEPCGTLKRIKFSYDKVILEILKALDRSVRRTAKVFPLSPDFPFLNHRHQAILCTETSSKATLKFSKGIFRII